MVTFVDLPLILVCRVDREANLDHASLQRSRRPEADLLEHAEHCAILGENLGDELLDTVGGGATCELLDEPCADPLPLTVVGDGEGCLGPRKLVESGVVPDCDDAFVTRLAHSADENAAVRPVRICERACVAVARDTEPVKAEEHAPG